MVRTPPSIGLCSAVVNTTVRFASCRCATVADGGGSAEVATADRASAASAAISLGEGATVNRTLVV